MAAVAAIMKSRTMLLLDPSKELVGICRRCRRWDLVARESTVVGDGRRAVNLSFVDKREVIRVVLNDDAAPEPRGAVHMHLFLDENLTFDVRRIKAGTAAKFQIAVGDEQELLGVPGVRGVRSIRRGVWNQFRVTAHFDRAKGN